MDFAPVMLQFEGRFNSSKCSITCISRGDDVLGGYVSRRKMNRDASDVRS